MKYEHLSIKETLTPNEYYELVAAMVNIQLSENEDGTFRYQPENLSAMLPSILAHMCIDGIEWDDDEMIMYSNDLVEKIVGDDHLWGVIEQIMPIPDVLDTTAPLYIQQAVADAEKKVQFVLNTTRPTDQFVNALVAILGDFAKLGEMIQTDNGKAILETLNRLVVKEEKPQQRRRRK